MIGADRFQCTCTTSQLLTSQNGLSWNVPAFTLVKEASKHAYSRGLPCVIDHAHRLGCSIIVDQNILNLSEDCVGEANHISSKDSPPPSLNGLLGDPTDWDRPSFFHVCVEMRWQRISSRHVMAKFLSLEGLDRYETCDEEEGSRVCRWRELD